MTTLAFSIPNPFGNANGELTPLQTAARALLVYVAALLLVRLGEKRFLGKNTAFDVILGFMLGSVLSRGITSTGLLASIGAGAVLVGLHWLLATAAFRFTTVGTWIKGSPRLLIKDGRVRREQMRKGNVTDDDLLMALRKEGQVDDPGEVDEAHLERSGDISVIPRSKTRVVEVEVKEGVQTVRIEITG